MFSYSIKPEFLQLTIFHPQRRQHSLSSSSGGSEGTSFNIYHDSNIEEVVRVKPVLQDFMARIQELLAEWPRHPTLLQVKHFTYLAHRHGVGGGGGGGN